MERLLISCSKQGLQAPVERLTGDNGWVLFPSFAANPLQMQQNRIRPVIGADISGLAANPLRETAMEISATDAFARTDLAGCFEPARYGVWKM